MVGDIHFTMAAYERLMRHDRLNVKGLCDVGLALRRFNRQTESRKCYKTAVEVLFQAIKVGHVEAALSFELLIHNAFVATIEDEDHYYRCYSDWRAEMARLGSRHRDPDAASPKSGNPRGIGFILPTGNLLGHTEVLFNLLRQRAVIEALGIAPRIYVLYNCDKAFLQRAAEIGVEVYVAARELPEGSEATEVRRLTWARARLREHDCGVAIWVSGPPASIFMLSAGLAPVQIFWALRFHPIAGSFIDGHITYGPRHLKTKVIGKTTWEISPVPLALEIVNHSKEAIAEVRRRYPQRFLMGTLARPDKINSKPFLDSVVRILQTHPETGYVWTGRTQHPTIQQVFESSGVADRCCFAGWVDTSLYAQALDLFLETFPLGCGVTGYQALGAGTALLSYLEENTVYGMQFGKAQPLGNGGDPILCARNPEEYVELAGKLITDRAFREATAARSKEFFEREINNGEYYTRRFFETVSSIAEKTLAVKRP